MNFRILLVLLALSLALGCGDSNPPATDGKVADGSPPTRVDPPDPPIIRPPRVPPITEARPLDELTDDELVQCLGHEERSKRQESAERLRERGAEMVAKLIDALNDENVHVRAGAVYALGIFGSEAEAAIPRLEELREQDAREEVRDAAPFVIDAIQGR